MRILTNARYESLVTTQAWSEHLTLHMEHLTAQVKKLEQQVADERARANRAVDAQLSVRGFPMVTPPREGMADLPDVLEEDPEKVAKIEARMARGDATVFAERW